MFNTIMPNIFLQQYDPTQFSIEETEVSFNSIHIKLAITNIHCEIKLSNSKQCRRQSKRSGGH